ncbi:hypothetical protein CYMTET_35792, partial [Cymbomonas tetramitiformis]
NNHLHPGFALGVYHRLGKAAQMERCTPIEGAWTSVWNSAVLPKGVLLARSAGGLSEACILLQGLGCEDSRVWAQRARRSLFQTASMTPPGPPGAGMPPPGPPEDNLPLDLPPASDNGNSDTDSDEWISEDLRYVLLLMPSFLVLAGLIVVVIQSVSIWHGRQRAAEMLRLENARSSMLMTAADRQTSAK